MVFDFQGPQGGDEEASSLKEAERKRVVDKSCQGGGVVKERGVHAVVNQGEEGGEGEEEGESRIDKSDKCW